MRFYFCRVTVCSEADDEDVVWAVMTTPALMLETPTRKIFEKANLDIALAVVVSPEKFLGARRKEERAIHSLLPET
jgi:hypothetical protein